MPDVTGLIKEMQKANEQAEAMQQQQALIEGEAIAGLSPEEMAMFEQLPPEEQQAMLQNAMSGGV